MVPPCRRRLAYVFRSLFHYDAVFLYLELGPVAILPKGYQQIFPFLYFDLYLWRRYLDSSPVPDLDLDLAFVLVVPDHGVLVHGVLGPDSHVGYRLVPALACFVASLGL